MEQMNKRTGEIAEKIYGSKEGFWLNISYLKNLSGTRLR